MKFNRRFWRQRGLTITELLVILALIIILMSIVRPPNFHSKSRAKRAGCLNQLREIGNARCGFTEDHDGLLPNEVSTNQGGARELVEAGEGFRQFESLEVRSPRILVCSDDKTLRIPAKDSSFTTSIYLNPTNEDGLLTRIPMAGSNAAKEAHGTFEIKTNITVKRFASLARSNVSYFVCGNAKTSNADLIWAGDGNLTLNGNAMPVGDRSLGPEDRVGWSEETHGGRPNLLMMDGSVQTSKSNTWVEQFWGTNRVYRVSVP